MKRIITKIAEKILSWSNSDTDAIVIYLPADVVEREATSSEDLVDHDLYILHCACVDAWRSRKHP